MIRHRRSMSYEYPAKSCLAVRFFPWRDPWPWATEKPRPLAILSSPSTRPTPRKSRSTPRSRTSLRRSSNYLPASKTVPTPEVVLGDVAGAPGILPYAEDVYKYMRLLEKASPRVKVFSIGKTEEGREMIAVAISSPENLKNLEQNRAAPREAGRSPHHQAGRRGSRQTRRASRPRLLHHRHHPLPRNRRAHRV